MDELVAGAKLIYVLSAQEAASINEMIAKYPDRQPAGSHVEPGQRVPAIALMSLGPQHAGPERLAVRLDGGTTPPEKNYHVWASDLQYADGAWHKPEEKA